MGLKSTKMISKHHRLLISVNKNLNHPYSRSALKEKVVPIGDNTLTGRILLYLNNGAKHNEATLDKTDAVTIINKLKQNTNVALCKLSHEQLLDLFRKFDQEQASIKRNEIITVLKAIDLECCLRLKEMDFKMILRILNVYMKVSSNHITDYKFYSDSIDYLSQRVDYSNKKYLLQFVFYVGLQKKTKRAKIILQNCVKRMSEDFILSLTPEECCIICNSTFKTSTKIKNPIFLNRIVSIINDNLYLLNDPALFITMVKTIRHNKHQNMDLLSSISCTIFFNKTLRFYSFTALCHILALFADFLYYDENLLKLFVKKCIELLQSTENQSKETYLTEQIRQKDLTTFLWSITKLGYNDLGSMALETVIVPKILAKIQNGEYQNDFDSLVDTLLYLWMLNYREESLFKNALTKEKLNTILAKKSKSLLRMNLLLNAIQFENRKLYKELDVKVINRPKRDLEADLNQRILLNKTYQILKNNFQHEEINSYHVNHQIPNLNIRGITGYKNKIIKAVHFEILDDTTCVKNKEGHINGLMQLKLRLLEQSKVPVILVKQEEVQNMTDEELELYLKEEMLFLP